MKFICTLFDERMMGSTTIKYHLEAGSEEEAEKIFLNLLPLKYQKDEVQCRSEEGVLALPEGGLRNHLMSEMVHWTKGWWQAPLTVWDGQSSIYRNRQMEYLTGKIFRQNMAVLQGDTPELDTEYGHLLVTEPQLAVDQEFCQKNLEELTRIYLSYSDWKREPRPLFPWEK